MGYARNDHDGWGGWVYVPDSDRGDFRRHAVDISSSIWLEVFLRMLVILKNIFVDLKKKCWE